MPGVGLRARGAALPRRRRRGLRLISAPGCTVSPARAAATRAPASVAAEAAVKAGAAATATCSRPATTRRLGRPSANATRLPRRQLHRVPTGRPQLRRLTAPGLLGQWRRLCQPRRRLPDQLRRGALRCLRAGRAALLRRQRRALRRGRAGLAPAQRLPDPLRQRRLHRVHARRRALLWAHRADLRSRWERLGGQPAVQRLVP